MTVDCHPTAYYLHKTRQAKQVKRDRSAQNTKGSAFPGTGMGMPPGMDELFNDPEIAEAMKNPKLLKAMEEIRTGAHTTRFLPTL